MSDKTFKWKMQAGNTLWVKNVSARNMTILYNFLEGKTDFKKKRIRRFTYNRLSIELKIDRKQIRYYCLMLAFKKNPLVKIIANKYINKKGVKIAHEVQLIPPNIGNEKTPRHVSAHGGKKARKEQSQSRKKPD